MKSLQSVYLVPYDFTKVSEWALHLALQMAKKNNKLVYLLNIAKNQHDKIKAREKFDTRKDEMKPEDRELVLTRVIVGDIFEDLAKAGSLLNTAMIVMGTHGATGLQKVFGSNAEKVIASSSVPVLIVRENEKIESFGNIVMPFSFVKETIQILRYAATVAKEFDSTIHLVAQHDKDEWLQGHVKVNQKVARTFLSENGIKHEIVNLEGKKKGYEKELISFADEINAGIIAATYYKEGVLPRPNSFIQEMMENKAYIPLLTINADELSVASNTLGFLTA